MSRTYNIVLVGGPCDGQVFQQNPFTGDCITVANSKGRHLYDVRLLGHDGGTRVFFASHRGEANPLQALINGYILSAAVKKLGGSESEYTSALYRIAEAAAAPHREVASRLPAPSWGQCNCGGTYGPYGNSHANWCSIYGDGGR